MAYWTAARFQPRYERLALHFLKLSGFEVYAPRLRAERLAHGRKVEATPLLFPGYLFVLIEQQWYGAHRCVGTIGLVLSGGAPARVPDAVVAELKSRERGGLVELTKPLKLCRGARVKVTTGPFAGQLGLVAGMRLRDRVTVLLTLLGSAQRVELPKAAIEPV